MKLSIVIPVYNVEDTLDRCVESVLRQGIGDFEVILVDDGSRDRSAAICDEWQAKDAHILVIHQENRGLSAARNAGISRATGELITFVDSDDFLKEGTYSGIIALAERYALALRNIYISAVTVESNNAVAVVDHDIVAVTAADRTVSVIRTGTGAAYIRYRT